MMNDRFYIVNGRLFNELSVDNSEPLVLKPFHASAPRVYFFLCINECKGNPTQVAGFYFIDVFQCE